MARVNLANVSKTYPGGVSAVAHFSLTALDRQFVVLLGPSGCGKTTTLRMIAGLESPTTGEIRIGERVVNDVPPAERNIAMVFQNYALYPHMTVYKNMAFGLEMRYGGGPVSRLWRRIANPREAERLGRLRSGIREQVVQTARQLGIEKLLDRKPGELSGGERQRVALGRAIVRSPEVFLFDEPLSNLDARLRVEMRRELKQLHQRLAATMIYVTHDQTEALTLGDRIVVMHGGEIQQEGSPLEVYDWPRNRFVAGFLGTPPMNLLEGRLESREGKVWFAGAGWRVELDASRATRLAEHVGREATWGVRPESLRLAGDAAANDAGRRLSGVVELVETLGEAVLVHVNVGPATGGSETKQARTVLVCRCGPREVVKAGERVGLMVETERAHVFAGESGENITLQAR